MNTYRCKLDSFCDARVTNSLALLAVQLSSPRSQVSASGNCDIRYFYYSLLDLVVFLVAQREARVLYGVQSVSL